MDNHKERHRQQEFIDKMVANGYELFKPEGGQYLNYEDIKRNFKIKLENINGITFSENEFNKIYSLVNKGYVFEKSVRLLRELDITLDNGDNQLIRLIDKKNWHKNTFQIAQEVETGVEGIDGKTARFDSIIFINGLPLVILEFKQSATGNDKGINQIIDYQKDGKMHDLFLYCQIFVSSCFSTTVYFANNDKISRDFIFKWTDEENNEISYLIDGNKNIYDTFLSRSFIYEMIVKYMIRKEASETNVILRPYQVYATKKILQKVEENNGNGYIFHTTGSGKTITSFKTCKLLTEFASIDKVIFLVDRKDLDNQTKSEYDEFEQESYDNANNAPQLKTNILSNSNKIIVGTIQKMIKAVKLLNEEEKKIIKNKRVVIIIDECHRSQADTTVNTLRKVFVPNSNTQYFGFTGTPIFDENSKVGMTNYKTTKSIFGEELHRYSITDAVRDENVLQFNISQPIEISDTEIDFNDEIRIKTISEYIIDKFDNYTDNRLFNAILATSSKEQLKLYYKALKEYNETKEEEEKIKFTCIFSVNPDDSEEYVDNLEDDFIIEVMEDYNKVRNTNLNVKSSNVIEEFKDKVYTDIKWKDLDLVIVVNMLLTGFDSPRTKTLFVDKNLKYHTLLQAYSRVNRKCEGKRFGNVVTFVNQKADRDQALELFSAGGIYTDFEIEDYNKLVSNFNTQLVFTHSLCKDGEELRKQLQEGNLEVLRESLEAIKQLQRQYLFIKIHPEFNEKDINISKKELNDFKDVYKEVCKSLNGSFERVSDDKKIEQMQMDFELGMFEEDRVNLEYLLNLTQNKLKVESKEDVQEGILSYEIPLEIREALSEAVENYDESKNEDILVYLQEVLEKNKYSQYYDYANRNEIKDIDKFIELALEQERGEMSFSQRKKYDKLKEIKNFKEKRVFRINTYNFVGEINKAYNINI